MDNAGVYSLGQVSITTAATQSMTAITNLAGMGSCAIYARLIYGSGGTSVAAVVQTSLDQGSTWIDIARFGFTTANASKIANLNGGTAKGVTSVSSLGSEGVLDGLLGDRLRLVVTSVGTYADNTLLSVWAVAR